MNPSTRECGLWVVTALVVAAAFGLPANVFGLAMERKGNAPFGDYEEWKGTEIMPVINHTSRVHHTWCNGNEHFYYRGDTEALNDILHQFAAVKLEVREVVLRPGPARTRTFDDDTVVNDWQLHLLTGLAGHDTPSGAKMNLDGLYVGERNPTLTVFIGGGGNVRLNKLWIPKGVTVIGPGDLRKRYLEALKSGKGEARGYAAYALADLEPHNRENVALIVPLLEDEEAAWSAAGALAKMGKTAEDALPAIRRALGTQDERGRKRYLEVIEEIRRAADTTEEARFHREMTDLLDGFARTGAVRLPQPTPEQSEQARALIRQFSSAEFAARRDSAKKLSQMGPAILPHIHETLAKTDDAEVRFRCNSVLDVIGRRYGVSGQSRKAE